MRVARPWIDANIESATQDPLTLSELGRVATDVKASELLLKQAARSVDAAKQDLNAESLAKASIDVAKYVRIVRKPH